MKVWSAPDHRFGDLPDCGFAPDYVMVDDIEDSELRVHYLDEGPKTASPVLMMQAHPSCSCPYRHKVQRLAAAGFRVIAPDLVGLCKPDKPAERTD